MGIFSRQLPDYLRGKYELSHTVTYTVLFSVLFLLVSIPYSHNSWLTLGRSRFYNFTLLFAVNAVLLVVLSNFILYKTRNKIRMTVLGYVAWRIVETLLIVLEYSFITIPVTGIGWEKLPMTIATASIYGTISLIIPYLVFAMHYIIKDQNRTIRLMKYDTVISDEPIKPSLEKITLFDNSGNLKFCVSSSNLYYIASDDNYILVWYADAKGELKKYMLRCRLKTVEESFRNSNLVRCHRKYIVNMDKVKVLRKEKEGYELDLDNDSIPPIPVTKTYSENVLRIFNDSRLKNCQ